MNTQNVVASAGLAVGAVFGLAGSFVQGEGLQHSFYEISSLGLILGCVLLTLKFFRAANDWVAAGFLTFGIAEAIMSVGTAAGDLGGQSSFAAGMALYVPAFLLVSLPKGMPLAPRITGVAACIPFGISAAKVFWGGQALPSDPIVGAGYGLLVLTIIGWIWMLMRKG